MKAPKISEPHKYAGSPSHDDFLDWLGEFLIWLKCHYICGPANDGVRTTFLGLYVTGTVADWYLTEINNPTRHYDPTLRIQDVICLMHKQFVRTVTANSAVVRYHTVRYAVIDGIEGLFYKLDRAAEHMIERPSDYEFKYRLFNCLPRWLHDKLKDRNILPEYSTLEDLQENARQLEENSLQQYEGVGDIARTPATPATNPATAARANILSRPAAAAHPAAVIANHGRASVPTTARPAAPAQSRGPMAPRPARPARDTSTMMCSSCGEVGHISSEQSCKNYEVNRARLHAQREMHPDDDDAAEDLLIVVESEEYTPTWGGSQYDSDPEPDAIALGDDTGDGTRIGAMHFE
ncbi:hypothetical protein FIBSPDRAFT_949270 [Athelia psychrophila]|uniref:CCHC-type domain-containing protein n=1 Tax=Athelia psychrophila TaxID=1759441 RepID=A0A166Q2N4_9AGAM|nr:hypothetical protein FIBSPDRAFT_949270 [Fibularhizoctonia sp. CBS 109695]